MEKNDFDYGFHEKLRERTAKEADNVLWTFKAYYKAADWYNSLNNFIEWVTIALATALTIGVLWKKTPDIILISLAILTAVISGYKKASCPRKKAEQYYRTGDDYQRLFDDFLNFIKLELSTKDLGLDEMKRTFERLFEKRKNLNKYSPDLRSRWYEKLDDSIYEQVETTKEVQEKLTKEAKLIQGDEKDVDESMKDFLKKKK